MDRQIQFIKERMRAHHANLPFPSFTSRIKIELANHVVMFFNAFPPNSVLSMKYIPSTIMMGKALDCNKIFKLHFRAYVQVHKYRNVTNML